MTMTHKSSMASSTGKMTRKSLTSVLLAIVNDVEDPERRGGIGFKNEAVPPLCVSFPQNEISLN